MVGPVCLVLRGMNRKWGGTTWSSVDMEEGWGRWYIQLLKPGGRGWYAIGWVPAWKGGWVVLAVIRGPSGNNGGGEALSPNKPISVIRRLRLRVRMEGRFWLLLGETIKKPWWDGASRESVAFVFCRSALRRSTKKRGRNLAPSRFQVGVCVEVFFAFFLLFLWSWFGVVVRRRGRCSIF